jgi:hypothetical protein
MAKSQYLEKDRLANVIAAIQILGVSECASGTIDRWAAELEASEELTPEQIEKTPVRFVDRKKWQTIFEQHPEFFKCYTTRGEPRVALRWRYAQTVNGQSKLNGKGVDAAEAQDQAKSEAKSETKPEAPYDLTKVPSRPLTADQIQVLISTAIELHGREAAAASPPDRFHAPFLAVVGALLGSIAGGVLVAVLASSTAITRIFD